MSFTDFEIKRELERKSLHIPGLLVPYAYQYLPYLTLGILVLVSFIYYFSELRRINKGNPLPVIGFLTNKLTRSTHLDLAPIYLALGLGIAAVVFPFKAAMAGALLVCICDAVAAVVGMRFGRKRILMIRKTYLGTGAFFIAGVLVLWPLLGIRGALLTSGVSTLVEAIAVEGIDNLFLPIVGGALAKLFL